VNLLEALSKRTHLTYDDLEAEAMLSHDTLFNFIHNGLKLKTVTLRRVSHQLTPSTEDRKGENLQREFG